MTNPLLSEDAIRQARLYVAQAAQKPLGASIVPRAKESAVEMAEAGLRAHFDMFSLVPEDRWMAASTCCITAMTESVLLQRRVRLLSQLWWGRLWMSQGEPALRELFTAVELWESGRRSGGEDESTAVTRSLVGMWLNDVANVPSNSREHRIELALAVGSTAGRFAVSIAQAVTTGK